MDTKDILKKLRSEKKLTLQEVSEKSGVSYSAYQKYELGIRELGAKSPVKLADCYGVSVNYLLGREEAPDPMEQLAKLSSMEVTEEVILEKYLELPKASRKIVINFMKSAIAEAEARAKQTEQAEEKQTKPNIKLNQGLAVARTSDPDKLYRPAPTDEQLKSFTPCTPDMLGEDE